MICSKCKANCSDDSLYCGNCGQSLIGSDMQITRNDFTHELKNNRSINFNSGESFGERYRIISKLGKGGMGQVFKAYDSVLDIEVALKMIRPEFLMNKKMISRFKQEILLAREITHENVSRIHDFGDVDGIKFISMEFIRGRTLKGIVRENGPFEVERAIEILKAICSGLSAAHKKDIIHRDLKPQNIMIDENDHVFITDFGLAKSVREENISHTGLVIGTPQYIPPELWKGEVADKRSDIYSLGIIAYEMIAGEELFQSDSDYGYLKKHVNEDPEFPSDIKDKLPSFFRQLILRCLAKDRDARYQDCGEIYKDIEDRIYSTGTFLNDFERSIKKTGFKKIGITFMLILVISFIGSLILKKGQPVQKKRSVAILYFKNLSGIKDLDHFSYSLPELLTTDLGQSKYIKVLPEDKVSKILNKSNYLGASFLDEKMFEEIGGQADVNYLVHGSFIKSGNDLRITVKLRDSDSGAILNTNYVDASMNNIFPAIDKLTTRLKSGFNLSENEIFADIDSDIESITTSSHEALNHYITGKRLFNERDFKGSLKAFQKAVDIDPEFAMAYLKMARTYAFKYDWDKRRKYHEKTLQYINKLSVREKYLIYGAYYMENETTYQKSIDSYKKILEIYPFNYEANYHIGQTYRILDAWDEGIEYLSKALNEEKSSVYALSEIIDCYEGRGEYKKAEELLKNFRKKNGNINTDRIIYFSYMLSLKQKKYEFASNLVDQRNDLAGKENSGKKFNKGVIYILQGDFDKAVKVVGNLKKSTDSSNYPDMNYMKYLYLHQGKFNDYEKQMNKEISKKSFIGNKNEDKTELIYFYIGSGIYNKAASLFDIVKPREDFPIEKFIFLSLEVQNELGRGNIEISKSLIKKLEHSLKESIFKKLTQRLFYQVLGKYHKMKGNYKRAEDYYLKSLKNLGKLDDGFSAPYFYNTAIFYFEQKRYKKAEELLKHIHDLSFARLQRGDLYAKSFYYLGKIYQKKGSIKKAINSYNKFYDMWKDGDPEFVGKYVTETIKQLEFLKRKI